MKVGAGAMAAFAGSVGANSASAQAAAGGINDLLKRVRTPHKHPELVIGPSFEKGTFDSMAVDCPFVFSHDGRYWMTFIGFDGTGYRTGLAHSTDLIHWTKEGLLLDRGPKGSVTEFNIALTWIVRDNDLLGPGTLTKVKGRYLGTYHAYPKPGYETGAAVIGLCWSDDLRHWELEEPCLRSSDAGVGTWEAGGLYKSCLVQHEGVFYMFYNAKTAESPWIEQTGLAISEDLKTWERYPRSPVIPVGPKGAFDDIFCSDPCVLRIGNTWAMFYYTLGSDGKARDTVAFSDDLLTWQKSNEILIDVGAPGSVDSTYAHKPAVFSKDGKVYHYYCAVSPTAGRPTGNVETGEFRGIAVATSE